MNYIFTKQNYIQFFNKTNFLKKIITFFVKNMRI